MMQCRIRKLSEQVKNQISAGEVIENPSSVVKELVENSIDAGASEISIEIRAGGMQLIRIADNGCGMTEEEVVLAFARHATSKIVDREDLDKVDTLGFRGEALPSIASISHCHITTYAEECSREEGQGISLTVEGGKYINRSPVVRKQGTTVEVSSLFFNVPVRKKFQRSQSYHSAEIHRIVTLQALAYPEISFRLINGEKEVLYQLPSQGNFASALEENSTQLLGKDFVSSMTSFDHTIDHYRLVGLLGSPEKRKKNRRGQYVFINRRPVRMPLISRLIQEGYGTMIPSGQYPLLLMHCFLPHEVIDVNVHPQKWEVRLLHTGLLRRMISQIVTEAMKKVTPSPLFFSPPRSSLQAEGERSISSSAASVLRERIAPFHIGENLSEKGKFLALSSEQSEEEECLTSSLEEEETSCSEGFSPEKKEEQLSFSSLFSETSFRMLSLLPPHYLLIDLQSITCGGKEKELWHIWQERAQGKKSPQGILCADLQAIEARLVWESLEKKGELFPCEEQLSFFASAISCTLFEVQRVKQYHSVLEKMGIRLEIHEERTGEYQLNIIGSSYEQSLLPEGSKEELFSLIDLLEEEGIDQSLKECGQEIISQKRRKIIQKTFSQRRHLYTEEEGRALMASLLSLKDPFDSPIGRKTVLVISLHEIRQRMGGWAETEKKT